MNKSLTVLCFFFSVWSGGVFCHTCLFDHECQDLEKCVGAEGVCRLPAHFREAGSTSCSRHKECTKLVSGSKCQILKRGKCSRSLALCQFDTRWVERCPEGFNCEKRRCVEYCKPGGSDRQCSRGQKCCSTGRCSYTCPQRSKCSPFNPAGFCPSGQLCKRGVCQSYPCSRLNPYGSCLNGRECVDGECRSNSYQSQIDFMGHRCSPSNLQGFCDNGRVCQQGRCLSYNECSANDWNGVCPGEEEVCKNGICVSSDHQCSLRNVRGFCPGTEVCISGYCRPPDSCHITGCLNGKVCLENKCVSECSHLNSQGYCPSGYVCTLGTCLSTKCALVLCPTGYSCLEGDCVPNRQQQQPSSSSSSSSFVRDHSTAHSHALSYLLNHSGGDDQPGAAHQAHHVHPRPHHHDLHLDHGGEFSEALQLSTFAHSSSLEVKRRCGNAICPLDTICRRGQCLPKRIGPGIQNSDGGHILHSDVFSNHK